MLLLISNFANCQQPDPLTPATDTAIITTGTILTAADTILSTADTVFKTGDTVLITADTILISADTIITTSDTTTAKVKSPRKASIYSAVCPGLGQIYNHKYWKVPIVYLGLGVCVGSTIYNARNFAHYKDKYIYMLEQNLNEYEQQTLPEVKWYKDTHKRYRDLFFIITAGFYALQIVDASVDAHLFDFDVGDDLTMIVDPVLAPSLPDACSLSLRCCLYF
jgi:hypothetical protein